MKSVIKIRKGEHEKETMECRKEIRLYRWELEELQNRQKRWGFSDSQYLRMLITNRPRDYPEIRKELERMNQEINRIGVNINQITHNNNSALYSGKINTVCMCVFEADKTLVSQVQERL